MRFERLRIDANRRGVGGQGTTSDVGLLRFSHYCDRVAALQELTRIAMARSVGILLALDLSTDIRVLFERVRAKLELTLEPPETTYC
jgi:hypothetical protein